MYSLVTPVWMWFRFSSSYPITRFDVVFVISRILSLPYASNASPPYQLPSLLVSLANLDDSTGKAETLQASQIGSSSQPWRARRPLASALLHTPHVPPQLGSPLQPGFQYLAGSRRRA